MRIVSGSEILSFNRPPNGRSAYKGFGEEPLWRFVTVAIQTISGVNHMHYVEPTFSKSLGLFNVSHHPPSHVSLGLH